MSVEIGSVLILAGVAYGLLVGWAAGRVGRSRSGWAIAGTVAGPLVLPILLFAGARPGSASLVRRWLVVAAVLGSTVGGAACGAWLFAERHPVQPYQVVRRVGKR